MNQANDTSHELLRRMLQHMNGKYLEEMLPVQMRFLRRLGRKCPHAIRLHREAIFSDTRTWQFNCHAFALGLSATDEYWRIDASHPKVVVKPDFVESQIANTESIDASRVVDGDLVVYRQTGIEHTGIVAGMEVISKWGNGHTWRHPTFEMPVSYGSTVAYYRKLSLQTVVEDYARYAASWTASNVNRS